MIENYDKAINDKEHIWECHHRDEIKILPSGIKVIRSKEDLIEDGRYYNCPPNELIFLTKEEHIKLHTKNYTEEHKQKIRESLTGTKHDKERVEKMRKSLKGKTFSEFGAKFVAKFNTTRIDNPNLYARELRYYKKHGKCSWEE